MANARAVLTAYCVILTVLPSRLTLPVQLCVAPEGKGDESSANASSCHADNVSRNVTAALRRAHQIVNCNSSEQVRVELLLLAGSHSIEYGTVLTHMCDSLSLVGEDKKYTFLTCTRSSRSADTASAIILSSFQEVSLKQITVTGCMSYDDGNGAVLEMDRGAHLTLEHCHFRDNSGVAVLARDVSFIEVSWTTFSSSIQVSNMSAGLYVAYSTPADNTSSSNNSVFSNTLSVANSNFESLTYLPPVSNSTSGKKLNSLDHGAGISVVLNDDTGNIRINMTVTNSTFLSNMAHSGAGMYVNIDQMSSSSSITANITIRGCRFYKCTAVPTRTYKTIEWGHGGGLVAYLYGKSEGVMEISDSHFESNEANTGAAVGVFYFDEAWNNKVTIVRSQFWSNIMATGGAVVFDGGFLKVSNYPRIVTVRDVSLEDNRVSSEGQGSALVSLYVSISLDGSVTIIRNSGTAVDLMAGAWLIARGNVTFLDNTGRDGGALHLQSNSQLRLHDSARVVFMRNSATRNGGAVMAETTEIAAIQSISGQHLHKNRLCFISSSHHYSHLNRNTNNYQQGYVAFVNNSADMQGGAIYADSIDGCSWSEEANGYKAAAAITSPNFMYRDNRRSDIGSGVAVLKAWLTIHVQQGKNRSLSDFISCNKNRGDVYCVNPGISYTLSVAAIDKLGHSVYTSVAVSTDKQSSMRVVRHHDQLVTSHHRGNVFSIVTDPITGIASVTVYFQGKLQQNTGKVMVQSDSDGTVRAPNLTVFLEDCVPGFRYEPKYYTCMCDSGAHVDHCTLDGSVQPDAGYWVGQVQRNDSTQASAGTVPVSFWCPMSYCSCPNGTCEFNMRDTSDPQCAEGREGILCGRCKHGYSAVYGAIYPACLPCSDEVLWIIPVLTMVAFILVALAVLINFNASSKRLRSIAFFFQVVVLTLSAIPPQGILQYKWIAHLAWMPNLSIRLDACLLDNLTTLQSTLFQYYVPTCIFVFMAMGVFLARKFAWISRMHVLRPFWSMVTLTYISIGYTTALILNCVDIGDGELRWFPDATVKCYEGSHQNAAIVAFLIAGLYVLPLPLFLALAMPRISKLKPICDIFLEPIKPSHWWAEGWYFFRRLLLVIFHCFSPNPKFRHTLVISLLSIFLAVHAQFQPYSQTWVNRLETALILNLCLISAFQMYNTAGPVPPAATIVFFLLPYVAAFLYLIYYVVRKIKKHCLKTTQQPCPTSHAKSNHVIGEESNEQDTTSNDDSSEGQMVPLVDVYPKNKDRLSASFERDTAMDVMDDSTPFLREPLLKQTLTSKPT